MNSSINVTAIVSFYIERSGDRKTQSAPAVAGAAENCGSGQGRAWAWVREKLFCWDCHGPTTPKGITAASAEPMISHAGR